MSKSLTLTIIFGLLFVHSLIADDRGQAYLNSQKDYQYIPPTGKNAPTVYPLEGLDLVPYGTNEHGKIWMVNRHNALKYAPCSECHQSSNLPQQKTNHEEIKLHHGSATSMHCYSCHQKQDVAKLKIPKNNVDFNQAPKLCYQCHSSQYKDWKHGAHGKRIGSWTGKRVIMNCTECHNPHQPGFKKRIPDPGPKLGR